LKENSDENESNHHHQQQAYEWKPGHHPWPKVVEFPTPDWIERPEVKKEVADDENNDRDSSNNESPA
jgi:hypothetical protein